MDSLTIMLAIVIAILCCICLFLRSAIKAHNEEVQSKQPKTGKYL